MTHAPNRARTTGPALEKWYQFVRWLLPAVEKLPRSHKFTLGERLATDLQLMDLRKHEFAARAVDEVGRLVGGWIKAKPGPTPVSAASANSSGVDHAQAAH